MLWIVLAAVSTALAESSRPLVILPADNPSGFKDAALLTVPRFVEEFQRRGIPTTTSDGDLRDLLRQHRIRSVGQIGHDDAVILRNESGGRALVFLSIDLYRREELGIELGLSARVLDLDTLRLSAAASHGATSESYATSFGRGRIYDIETLADRVVRELVDKLLKSEADAPTRRQRATIALIQLENGSSMRGAADIIRSILISGLVARSYDVLEPGFAHELFLRDGQVHRGAIDFHSLELLHRDFQVGYVLTGSVESLQPARGDLEVSVPSARVHLRLIEAPTGRIVLTHDFEDDGTIAEGFFGRGRETATLRFLELAMSRFIDRLNDTLGEESHASNQP